MSIIKTKDGLIGLIYLVKITQNKMYLTWAEQTIADFSEKNINSLYGQGFLFTREDKGKMYQTRSIRINLSKFELSSENRRVLKKIEDLRFQIEELPVKNYNWQIGKLAKDFYETKFGKGIFSANKVKELLTTKHNFNILFQFVIPSEAEGSLSAAQKRDSSTPSFQDSGRNDTDCGYCICYENQSILHYSYPFYNLKSSISNLGIGMMLRAIIWAKENNKKYVYLGSAKDAKAKYKLQFAGLEWFDGKEWKTDLEELKKNL